MRSRRKIKKSRRNRRKRVLLKYKLYIESKFWRRRKDQYFATHAKRCAVCRTPERVDLHHKAYGNYGRERDEDLVALCKKHHEGFHAKHGVARDMRLDTDSYVHTALFDETAQQVMRAIQ